MPSSSPLTSDPVHAGSSELAINRHIAPPLELGLPYWFHLFFPDRALTTNLRILVAGCDDDLAVRLARANPRARVVAVERRREALAATEQAAEHQSLANLEPLAAWPAGADADAGFDLIYYNQPSWSEEPPQSVLFTAASLLRLEGSLHLTVRAKYAWSGVGIVRELLEKLKIEPDAEGYPRAREIVAALASDHPWNLLGPDPRLRSDDLLADWLGDEQPSFSVPELYELLAASGLTLQRFTHQPYYLPQCSPLARTPLLSELRQLPLERQHALMELYWPGMRYHLAVACRTGRPVESFQIGFRGADWLLYAPLLPAKLPVEDAESLGAQARLCWRAAGMPELSVSLGGFQNRLLRALDRAEELAEVVGLASLSGDPQLRDEWARDFFQMMADYDFLHYRICHSARQPSLAPPAESPEFTPPRQDPWAELAELSEMQRHAEPPPDEIGAVDQPPQIPEAIAPNELDLAAIAMPEPGFEPEALQPLDEPADAQPEPLPGLDQPGSEQERNAGSPPSGTLAARAPDSEPSAADPPELPNRISYEACPLCAQVGYEPVRQVTAELAIDGRPLRIAIPWVRCRHCSHVFTDGYFAGDLWAQILQHVLRWRGSLRRAIRQRSEASRIVATITGLRESAAGRWLDVGCSNSGLVAVASEFGYQAAGVDCCGQGAHLLDKLGYEVVGGSLFDRNDGPFDVVSLDGVVDSMPFPSQALHHVHRLLAPHGLVYVSAPTNDSLMWRKVDSEADHPYWRRPERYHVFQRKSLFLLLRKAGFEPCGYGASGPGGVGMEVIACKT